MTKLCNLKVDDMQYTQNSQRSFKFLKMFWENYVSQPQEMYEYLSINKVKDRHKFLRQKIVCQ